MQVLVPSREWALVDEDGLQEGDKFVIHLLEQIIFVAVGMFDAEGDVAARADIGAIAIAIDDVADLLVVRS